MLYLEEIVKIESLAKRMRISALTMGYKSGVNAVHYGGGLSAIEILACLYGGIMDVDPKNPRKEPRDIFILSKGHGVLALYTALAHTGFFPLEKLETFEQNESDLCGHPAMNVDLGIEFSSGSLGMGFSQGVGVALGYNKKCIDNHVFILLGDGELDEGSNWEAAMSAAHFKLDSLLAIVDKNSLQLDGKTNEVMSLGNLANKFSAFGFETREVDGHNVAELCKNISEMIGNRDGRPKALIANTIKGKGVSFMENKIEWHVGLLTKKLYEEAMRDLGMEVN
ncbi:MAG: transketolase [Selenomonadaceae bacterium]|nr:transketolase [Selenomonadaceae bacterium]